MKYSYILQFSFLTLAASLSSLTLNAQDDCSDADILIYTEGLTFTTDAIEVPVGSVVNGYINTITSMSFNNPEAFYFDLISGDEEGVCIGTHTFTIEGLYNYDCSGYGHAGGGMIATLTVVGEVAGVDEQLTSETYISVYPNPVSRELTIESAVTDQPVVIYDASGRIVAQYNNSGKVNVDVSVFEIGVYTVKSAGNIARFIVE